jgi:hypothetical protein
VCPAARRKRWRTGHRTYPPGTGVGRASAAIVDAAVRIHSVTTDAPAGRSGPPAVAPPVRPASAA